MSDYLYGFVGGYLGVSDAEILAGAAVYELAAHKGISQQHLTEAHPAYLAGSEVGRLRRESIRSGHVDPPPIRAGDAVRRMILNGMVPCDECAPCSLPP